MDVLVPTHGRQDLTMQCLAALYLHTKTPFHLIIVDDSTDMTPLYLAGFHKDVNNLTIIHSDEPYKCGNQFFNIGLEHSKTPYIATVMNSVRVEPGWELQAVNMIDSDPRIGIIGFKCLLPNGFIESAGIKMYNWWPTDIGRDEPAHRYTGVYECDAVQWAFALVRKEAMVGNLDETIWNGFVGWDDIDNCFVLKSKNWKIVFCGMGAGYHTPRATRGDDSPRAERLNEENGIAFYKRWGFWEEYQKARQAKVEKLAKDIHLPPPDVEAMAR